MARHNEIGKMGEDIAAEWLKLKDFLIVERNYNKKWGEIDIIAKKNEILPRGTQQIHFIEVKTVSYETKESLEYAVSHETWRPEENVHKNKIDRLKRAIQTWLFENKFEGNWVTDVVTVRMVPREKFARVKFIENIIFE